MPPRMHGVYRQGEDGPEIRVLPGGLWLPWALAGSVLIGVLMLAGTYYSATNRISNLECSQTQQDAAIKTMTEAVTQLTRAVDRMQTRAEMAEEKQSQTKKP